MGFDDPWCELWGAAIRLSEQAYYQQLPGLDMIVQGTIVHHSRLELVLCI